VIDGEVKSDGRIAACFRDKEVDEKMKLQPNRNPAGFAQPCWRVR